MIDIELGKIYTSGQLKDFLADNESRIGLVANVESGIFLSPMFINNKYKITDIKEIHDKSFSLIIFNNQNKFSETEGISRIIFIENI